MFKWIKRKPDENSHGKLEVKWKYSEKTKEFELYSLATKSDGGKKDIVKGNTLIKKGDSGAPESNTFTVVDGMCVHKFPVAVLGSKDKEMLVGQANRFVKHKITGQGADMTLEDLKAGVEAFLGHIQLPEGTDEPTKESYKKLDQTKLAPVISVFNTAIVRLHEGFYAGTIKEDEIALNQSEENSLVNALTDAMGLYWLPQSAVEEGQTISVYLTGVVEVSEGNRQETAPSDTVSIVVNNKNNGVTFDKDGEVTPCAHDKGTFFTSNNDGTHSEYCNECKKAVKTNIPCEYEAVKTEDKLTHKRVCKDCKYEASEEAHIFTTAADENGKTKATCFCGFTATLDEDYVEATKPAVLSAEWTTDDKFPTVVKLPASSDTALVSVVAAWVNDAEATRLPDGVQGIAQSDFLSDNGRTKRYGLDGTITWNDGVKLTNTDSVSLAVAYIKNGMFFVSDRMTIKKGEKIDNTTESERLKGSGRYQTAVEISKAGFDKAETVVLASGKNYADALAGVPFAYALNTPILLTEKTGLNPDTLAEMKRLGTKNVIILGGSGAISSRVEDTLKANGIASRRIKGNTRFETAVKLADELKTLNKGADPTEIFFVYSDNYADALSVGPVAALKKAPIIYLAKDGAFNESNKAYLEALKKTGSVKQAYVIGGSGAISDAMMEAAGSALGLEMNKTINRVKGGNKYETCVVVNETFADVLNGKAVCVATGEKYPDALAGGVFAANNAAPILLVSGDLSDRQAALLKLKAAQNIYVLGGSGSVSPELVSKIVNASRAAA